MFIPIFCIIVYFVTLFGVIKGKVYKEEGFFGTIVIMPIFSTLIFGLIFGFAIQGMVTAKADVDYKVVQSDKLNVIVQDQYNLFESGYKPYLLVEGSQGYRFNNGGIPFMLEGQVKNISEKETPKYEVYAPYYKNKLLQKLFTPTERTVYLFYVPKDKIGTYNVTGKGTSDIPYLYHMK